MNKYLKWISIFIFILTGIILTGFGAYRLYNYLIENATERIEKGVSKGISKGIFGVVNPFNW